MMVPPVPTPATNASGVSPCQRIWDQSSGPVLVACASTFCSFANCRGRNASGVSFASSSASPMLPRKPPSAADTSRTVAPKLRMSAFRSSLIQSGMKIVTGCPRARPKAAKEMPVFPLVASMIRPPGCKLPGLVGALDDVERHPVLDRAGEVQVLGLGVHGARAPVDLAFDGEERRVSGEDA